MPKHSKGYTLLTKPLQQQYGALNKMCRQHSERRALLDYVANMKPQPETAEAVTKVLQEKKDEHEALYSEDRIEWRAQFFKYLPYRQMLNTLERICALGKWKETIQSVDGIFKSLVLLLFIFCLEYIRENSLFQTNTNSCTQMPVCRGL